jgi:hypothetical protein
MHYFHPKRIIRGDIEDGVDCIESTAPGANDDSKDSLALKGIALTIFKYIFKDPKKLYKPL